MFDAETIPRGDVIHMKHILHDWSDEAAVEILKACSERLNDGGRVVLAEAVLPEAGEKTDVMATQLNIDLLMLLIGGKERSASMWRELAAEAGMKVEAITATPAPMCQFITLTKT